MSRGKKDAQLLYTIPAHRDHQSQIYVNNSSQSSCSGLKKLKEIVKRNGLNEMLYKVYHSVHSLNLKAMSEVIVYLLKMWYKDTISHTDLASCIQILIQEDEYNEKLYMMVVKVCHDIIIDGAFAVENEKKCKEFILFLSFLHESLTDVASYHDPLSVLITEVLDMVTEKNIDVFSRN